MSDPTENEVIEATKALKELREIVESKAGETGEAKEKIAKLETTLDIFEEKNQAMVAKQAEAEKAALEMKEKMTELETKLARAPKGGSDQEVKAELKAFERLVQKGPVHLTEQEQKYLRTDNDTDGGYLAPNEYVMEILKKITELSPVRSVARVRRTSRGEIEIPKREGIAQGGWRGEGGDLASDNSKYGMLKVPAHHLDVIVPITNTMLTDSAFNMETEINSDVIENFAQLEGAAYVNGTGINMPEGFINDTKIVERNSGLANDIDPDNFFDLQGDLKIGYQGAFALNKRTLARVRKMKGSDGHYLFAPAAEGMTATIAGERYVIMQDMPDIAANAIPVVYGDWLRGYVIVDGVQLTIIRDPYSLAGTGKTRFIFSKRTGGKVQQAEALKKLKCAA